MTRRLGPMIVAAAAASVALMAGCAPGPAGGSRASSTVETAASAVVGRLDAATEARLQDAFERKFATVVAGVRTPGASVFVSVGSDVWSSQLGVADAAAGAPVSADGRWRIASVTKPFVAEAVLRLVEAGRLSLDARLDQFVPHIANGATITVRQLLDMSAGVWSFTGDQDLVARFDADPTLTWSVEQTVALIRAHPADFAPGTKVAYSDSNYVLLGLILQDVTGRTAAQVVTDTVIRPLGLTGTAFPDDTQTSVPSPAVVGYLPKTETLHPVTAINPAFAWTSGAMTSTVADLATWAKELTAGTLLSPGVQAERLRTRQFTGVGDVDYGYGLGVMRTRSMIGHTGGIIGFGTVVFRYPAADATFVVVVNASSNFDNASLDIYNALVAVLYPDQVTLPTGRN